MKSSPIRRTIQSACGVILLAAVAAFGDYSPTPGNPDTNDSDRNYDTNQPNSVPGAVQKTEDAGNRGLNKVDRGIHNGIHKTKRAGHKTKKKMNDEADKLTEPANKPQ